MNIRQHVARGADAATSVKASAKPAFRFSFIFVSSVWIKSTDVCEEVPRSPVWLTTYRDYIDIACATGKRKRCREIGDLYDGAGAQR